MRRKPPNIDGQHAVDTPSMAKPCVYSEATAYGYIPALDGLRAIAILLVLTAHFGFEHSVPGGFGVTVFFFISGFLISRQLSYEFSRTGKINFADFYMRRLLRLFPALIGMVFLSTALFMGFGGTVKLPEILSALLYMANYYDLYVMYHSHLAGVRHPFSILWSLAIEEHFYIIFPFLCVVLLPNAKRYIWVLIALLVAALLWRLYLWNVCTVQECGMRGNERFYKATDTRFDSILYGVLLTALWTKEYTASIQNFLTSKFAFIAAIALLFLTFTLRTDAFRETFRYSIQGIALIPIFAFLLCSNSSRYLRSILSSPILTGIGKLSYSLYLYHWIGLMAGELLHTNSAIFRFFFAAGITIALSLASYYGIERNMLKWRKKFGSHAG